MYNLGKADAYIRILDYLPNIKKDYVKYNFDIDAHSWETLQKSPLVPPALVEAVIEPDGSFAALFPAKRKYFLDNYIEGSSVASPTAISGTPTANVNTSLSQIKWRVIDPTNSTLSGLAASLKPNYDAVSPLIPGNYDSAPATYIGPEWMDSAIEEIPPPNDAVILAAWNTIVRQSTGSTSPSSLTTSTTTNTTTTLAPIETHYINQRKVRDGLFWVVESDPFLQDNMPFWVNIKKMRPPTSKSHPTFIIISMGQNDANDYYDLYLGDNSKPFIVDYRDKGVGAWGGRMFDVDLSRILTHEENIEVGFMVIGGRLVISVNKVNLIYTRVKKDAGDESGKLREAKIKAGPIRIYGSNIQASINVCPMTFAQQAIMTLPLPAFATSESQQEVVTYKGIRKDGTLSGSVCELPTDPSSNEQLYGVDCNKFYQEPGGATSRPKGYALHRMGEVYFFKGGTVTATAIPNSDYYFLQMKPQTAYGIPYAGTPYFFRLKGGYIKDGTIPTGYIQRSDIISMSQTNEGSDPYAHVKRSATITLYNKGGIYDSLFNKQYGIEIYMGWNGNVYPGNMEKTFTGLIVSVNTTEEPGKETITLNCEDYMYILKNIPIINSPYYDGMIKFYAVKDLVERAGVSVVHNDWLNYSSSEYALPSGYAFTKPTVKYQEQQMLFDCAIDMLKRDQSFFYFDENAELHVAHLPGGLFSVGDGPDSIPVAHFSRAPDNDDISEIILDQRSIDHDFSPTVNLIYILTVERDTRNSVVYSTSASPNTDVLPYKKPFHKHEPSLGGIEAAKVWAEQLAQRMFFPIRKMSFKTVGEVLADTYDFINVEGLEFRVTAITRKYSADTNELTNEYNCEWLGGVGGSVP